MYRRGLSKMNRYHLDSEQSGWTGLSTSGAQYRSWYWSLSSELDSSMPMTRAKSALLADLADKVPPDEVSSAESEVSKSETRSNAARKISEERWRRSLYGPEMLDLDFCRACRQPENSSRLLSDLCSERHTACPSSPGIGQSASRGGREPPPSGLECIEHFPDRDATISVIAKRSGLREICAEVVFTTFLKLASPKEQKTQHVVREFLSF
jgi:hypothetical protein